MVRVCFLRHFYFFFFFFSFFFCLCLHFRSFSEGDLLLLYW